MGIDRLSEKSAAAGCWAGLPGQWVVGCFGSCGESVVRCHWLLLYLLVFESLQDTLAYATALLNEKEQSGSSNGSESSPANENGERHLQQVQQEPVFG